MSRSLLVALTIAGSLTAASPVFADPTSSSPPPDEGHVELRVVNGRRVYVIPPTHVHGERQGPYQFTLPGRGPLGYTPAQTNHSDATRVVDAVRRAPF